MASCLSMLKSETRSCYYGRLLSSQRVVVSLVLLIAFYSVPVESQQLLSIKPQGNIQSSSDGVFVLKSSYNSSLLLFMHNTSSFTNSTTVKLTRSDSECDENDSLFGTGHVSMATAEEENGIYRVVYYVTFPLIKSTTVLYFCIKEDDSYIHQGNYDWLKLRVVVEITDWLPLPVRIIFIFGLMFLSGMFSGLNLGLMALDPTTLKIIEKSGTKKQKKYAKTIHRVRRHGNYLLCTLLLGNVLVNSTFTILLGDLVSGLYAVIGSTLAIVIFGEIIPQAICSRYGLCIGAHTIWLTYIFMVLTFPLSFPISLILNLILGKEIGAVYKRDQILELLHVTQKDAEIEDYEMDIISGALKFKAKTVRDVMTKFEHVFCVDIDAVLDFKTIKLIYDSGFSRIPIYGDERSNIVGVLYLRDLTFIDPDDCTPIRQVKDFYGRDPKFVFDDTSLEEMLTEFTTGQCHIAIIRCVEERDDADNEYITLGIVTLEDIIEEILGHEIIDECDQFEDNVTLKPRHRKHMDIGDMMYTTPIISLSAPQLLAVKQFLLSAVPPFQEPHITKSILHRLLQQDIVYQISLEESQKKDFSLYHSGTPASYFTLLLEGCLRVYIGKESLVFEARGFYHFGAKVLLDVIKSRLESSYMPDFTVRPSTDCLVMIITRQRYLAAFRASKFEQGQYDTKSSTNDLFITEWQAAETIDLQSSLSGRAGLRNITHLLKTKPLQGLNGRQSPNPTIHGRHFRSPSSRVCPTLDDGYDEDFIDDKDSEKKCLLGESGYTTTESISGEGSGSNSGEMSPIVEVMVDLTDNDEYLRTNTDLSNMESDV